MFRITLYKDISIISPASVILDDGRLYRDGYPIENWFLPKPYSSAVLTGYHATLLEHPSSIEFDTKLTITLDNMTFLRIFRDRMNVSRLCMGIANAIETIPVSYDIIIPSHWMEVLLDHVPESYEEFRFFLTEAIETRNLLQCRRIS